MRPIDTFSLQEHKGEYKDRPLKSTLYHLGKETGIKVPGYVIERQFELTHYFLLFMSWDCPFEEGCEVIVLNKQHKMVGNHSFSPFYDSFLLKEVIQTSEDHYTVSFDNQHAFELKINYPSKNFFSSVVKVKKLDVSQ